MLAAAIGRFDREDKSVLLDVEERQIGLGPADVAGQQHEVLRVCLWGTRIDGSGRGKELPRTCFPQTSTHVRNLNSSEPSAKRPRCGKSRFGAAIAGFLLCDRSKRSPCVRRSRSLTRSSAMPEAKTIRKAREDKREGKSASSQA